MVPLLKFSNTRKFVMKLGLSHETMHNTFLKRMPDAWRLLEELCISHHYEDVAVAERETQPT